MLEKYGFSREKLTKFLETNKSKANENSPVMIIRIGDKCYLRFGSTDNSAKGSFNCFYYGMDQEGNLVAIMKSQEMTPLLDENNPETPFKMYINQVSLAYDLRDIEGIASIQQFTPHWKVGMCGGASLDNDTIANLNEKERLEIYVSIFKGIEEMHKKNRVHGDLKPENIVLKINNDQKTNKHETLIIDYVDMLSEVNAPKNYEGTPLHTPPELAHAFLNELEITAAPSMDIWAAMITICRIEANVFKKIKNDKKTMIDPSLLNEILDKNPKNKNKVQFFRFLSNLINTRKNLLETIPEKNQNHPLNQLIYQMAIIDPNQRLTARQIVEELEKIQANLKEMPPS